MQLSINSGLATPSHDTLYDGTVKPKFIDSCTLRNTHAAFFVCEVLAHPLTEADGILFVSIILYLRVRQ